MNNATGESNLSSTGGGGGGTPTYPGVIAFQEGMYAFANTQGCVACHAAAVSPFYASADLLTAYVAAKTLVNFQDPTASLFVLYSGNNHCGVAACQSASSPATVSALLVQWANVENANGDAGPGAAAPTSTSWVTATVPMPTTIPLVTTTTAPVVVNFQLSALAPAVAGLSNAIFQVEVQMENATTYKIFNPRIGGNTSAFTIGGIHAYILPSGTKTGIGTEGVSPANLWDSLTGLSASVSTIASNTPTAPIAATPLTTVELYVQQQSSADSITFTFDSITSGAAASTNTFTQVNATIIQPLCISCHATATAANDNVTLANYAGVLAEVNKTTPTSSLIYTQVLSGAMPQGGTALTTTQESLLLAWIQAGALNN